MTSKRRGLGKGLDALLSTHRPLAADEPNVATTLAETPQQLSVNQLQPGQYQPRRDMDEQSLSELSASIRQQGLLQPIVVRPIENGYEIIAGERRWRASQMAGLQHVPVIVKNVDNETALALALIENLQREDLNVMDTVLGLSRLSKEFGMTHQQLANVVGMSRASISNLLRLEQLEPEVKIRLERGELEMGHARALLSLEGEQQIHAGQIVTEKGLSVRETESLTKKLQQTDLMSKNESVETHSLHFDTWQTQLTDYFAAPVQIKSQKNGQSQLIFRCKNSDELQRIVEKLQQT